MVVDKTPINVNNVPIENVEGYVYLGQHYSLKEKNQNKEIQRRIVAGWAAYAIHWNLFKFDKSNIAICLKRQVTTPVWCQLWHMVQKPGHWPNKHRTNMRPPRPKWKDVWSTAHVAYYITDPSFFCRSSVCRLPRVLRRLAEPPGASCRQMHKLKR